ncbi:hypothetical protein G3N58_31845, partial [Paraburkholderia sp. Ac-20342]|uniref:LysR substrate-binding domain-containing protein n=1 Tax=Paraburkholderia sp. Ac-20342 TaxID=2703889 RepID=UPI001F11AE09
EHQTGGLLFELGGKRTTLLRHQTPLHGEHSRLNQCLVSLDHYRLDDGSANDRTKCVHLEDLDFSNWIGLDATDPLGARINATLASLDKRDISPVIVVKTYYLARALVECGVGFTIIDEYTARGMGGRSSISDIEPAFSIGVSTMTPASTAGTHALKVFVQQLAERMVKT